MNPKAFDLYLKGITSGNSDYFEEATRLDPNFGMAYAKMASDYFYAGLFGAIPAREAFSKMREAAQKALDKDNTLGEAHNFLALAKLHLDFDWVGAEKEFKRAIELIPSLVDTRHFYTHFLLAANRIEESTAEIKLTSELDPFSEDMNLCFGWHCLFTKAYDEAIELASKGVQMKTEVAWSEVILGWSYEQKSMFREAITEFQNAVAQWKDGSIPLAGLAHAYAIAGHTKDARAVLQKLLEVSKQTYVPAYDIAAVYAGLGENDLAFEWLSKAFDERSGFLVYIKCDRRFDVLRSDPRFLELMRKMNLPS